MGGGWPQAAGQRRAFVEMVRGIEPTRLDDATWCGEWRVRDIAGHLSAFVDVPFPVFMFNIARAFGNYDKASDRMARKQATKPIEVLLNTIETRATKESALSSFPAEMTTADVTIHTEDVRRPLGLPGEPDPDAVAASLNFVATHKMGKAIIDPKKLEGLQLTAVDLGWSHGSGQKVSGSGGAILLALAGRPTFDELTGDGVATLQARI